MPMNSEIEKYFSEVNLNFQRLLEFLPVGAIFFNEKWNLISINSYAVSLLSSETDIEIPDYANIFSDNFLSAILPLNKVIKLKDGVSFEDEIENVLAKKEENKKFFIKGIPLIQDNIFKGGILILNRKGEVLDEKVMQTEPSHLTLQNILKQIYPCYFITNLEGKILIKPEGKDYRCNYYGLSIGKSVDEIFNSSQQTTIKQNISKAIVEKENQFLELKYYSDTESFTYNTVIIPLTNDSDEIQSLLFLFKEKDKIYNDTVDLLSNSKELNDLKIFALSGSEALFKTNLNGIITYWSEKSKNLFNRESDTVIGKYVDVIFSELNKNIFEKVRNELMLNETWEKELNYENDEEEFGVRTKVKLFKNNKVNEILFYCDKIDIRQQKLLQAKEEENNFFRDAVVKSEEIILQTNPYGTILFANEKFCNLFEYNLDEIRGIFFLDLIEHGYRMINDLTDFSSSVHKKSFETIPLLTKSGKVIDVDSTINISLIGTSLKYFTIYLKEVNYDNLLQLEITEALLNSFPNPIIFLKQNYIIKYNEKFEKVFDLNWDLQNHKITNIISEESKEEFEKFIIDNKIASTPNPIKIFLKEDEEIEVEFKKLNFKDDSENFVLEILPYLRESHLSDEEFKKNEFVNFDQVFWKGHVENNELLIDSITDSIEKLTEYENNNFLLYKSLWKDIIHPDEYEEICSEIQNFIKSNDQLIELEYRVIKKSGTVVWLNNKIKKIKNNNESIENLIGIITDVTNKVIQKNIVNKKIKELEKLNDTKDKFISIISHDLKAPFTSIVGFAELGLTDTNLSNEELREYIGYIKDASLHTLELVNGLLDWTRIQTGRLAVIPKTVNAYRLVIKTTEILNGVAAQKNISLNVDVDESIFIQADEGILTQVFNNLVSNSLKFTPQGGRIDIYAKQLGDQNKVEFTVRDTGVGIEEEDLKKLFLVDEKFTTLGTEGERGTGLGLSLVKEIIEKHNGKIQVKSELGKGSEFIFTIPMSTPSILIIDDKQSERLIYSKLVKSLTEGITIYSVSDFEEASNLVKDKMPMVIISESEINGERVSEFCESIGKTVPRYKPSFFILSRYISDDEYEKCKSMGVDAIHLKPIEIKLLKTILDNLIIGKR